MEQCGMTQTELQRVTCIPQPRISDYLKGKRDVNAETLRKMLEALELEIRPVRRTRRKGR
jgi:predicted XRE-type DNA-binding protein